MLSQILEILKYILPSIIVLIAAYLIVNKFLIREVERKRLAIFKENINLTMRLRMQAYERLSIFVERMKVQSLISRHYNQNLSVQDLQLAMVHSIRSEFEHNVSQQIYVSSEVWETVKSVTEQEITMINQMGSEFGLGTPAIELVKKMTEYMSEESEENLPTFIALHTINREAKLVLFPPESN
ncbi:MAG: hypothetical protein UZ11_BCD004001751 [Bacteroidetes bacterium OLB11]|nr:MAG: hypothetical protein UZ11_BCD004001751 [Bacteroidetes bacterium OLB11]